MKFTCAALENLSVEERVVVKDIRFPKSEIDTLRKQSRIVTHRVQDDADKYDKGEYVYAEDIDNNYCFEIVDKKVLTSIDQSPFFKELTAGQIAYLRKFDHISVLTLQKTKYERPYKLSYIKEHYPQKVYEMLKKDEVHAWRARTGIELIHLEPDKTEQNRIRQNWLKMPKYLKDASDAKCIEIFGVTNEEHHKIVKDEKNISDDSAFREIVAKYKSMFGFDLAHYKLVSTKTPRYNNGKPANFPREQFGGCWTTKGIVYLNSDLNPVIKFYGLKNVSLDNLKRTLIAHELGHGVYREFASASFKTEYLKKAKDMNFTTPYLEHVPEHKLKEETFCEFMSALICGSVKL